MINIEETHTFNKNQEITDQDYSPIYKANKSVLLERKSAC